MVPIDYSIIGKKFGALTVIDYDHSNKHHISYWKCLCDCGTELILPKSYLTTGRKTSCGCVPKVKEIDKTSLVGQTFGKLTVIGFSHVNYKHERCWLCECECGNKVSVPGSKLTSLHTKSCGCLMRERAETNLLGKTFGRLRVVSYDHTNERGDTYWLCKCECGNEIITLRSSLMRGYTLSCGCYQRDILIDRITKHGMSRERIYSIWLCMIDRCTNENNTNYYRYGGRGIEVCDEWLDFITFYEWAMSNGYDDELTIDRVNNDGNYCPENCRWATQQEQMNNTSKNRHVTYNGETHTIAEWSRIMNVSYGNLLHHVHTGNMSDFEEYFGVIDDECMFI